MGATYKGYINVRMTDTAGNEIFTETNPAFVKDSAESADVKQIIATAGAYSLTTYTGTSLFVINDGLSDVTVAVNSLSFVVKGGTFYGNTYGESMEINPGSFTSFTITATTAFRCHVRGV